MPILLVKPRRVVVIDKNHPAVELEYMWERGVFESLYGHTFPEDLIEAQVETSEGFFQTKKVDPEGEFGYTLRRYRKATDDESILWMVQNLSQIVHDGVQNVLPDHVYDSRTGAWELPPDKEEEQQRLFRESARVSESEDYRFDLYELILFMYDSGDARGVWNKGTLSTTLRDKIERIRTLVNDHKNDAV